MLNCLLCLSLASKLPSASLSEKMTHSNGFTGQKYERWLDWGQTTKKKLKKEAFYILFI